MYLHTSRDYWTSFLQAFLVQLKQRLRTPRHQHHLDDEEEDETDIEDDEDFLTRDNFNLNKMIVAVTAAGKVRLTCISKLTY